MLTLVWFLFVVNSRMSLKVTFVYKWFLAMPTLIRFLFGVNSHDVFIKGTFQCKIYLAMLTLIWFLFGMSPYVSFEDVRYAAYPAA